MDETMRLPQTLLEAIRHFSDPDICIDAVAAMRWPDGPECPQCGGKDHSFLTTRRLWKCKACKRQFSVKQGTIFEDSPIPLDKWLTSIWLIANAKNGISSHELGRSIGLTQKSAWFVLHRIRLAMQTGSFKRLEGDVEADETFIGGKSRFMHKDVRERRITGTGIKDKAKVIGVLKRGGEVRAQVVEDTKKRTLHGAIREHVAPGTRLYTDSHKSYVGLGEDYDHGVVDHAVEYVRGEIHVNGMENFWSLLKRGIQGTYVGVAPFHLYRYLDEQVFRFNRRKYNDLGRFLLVLQTVAGRRLTYRGLTGKA